MKEVPERRKFGSLAERRLSQFLGQYQTVSSRSLSGYEAQGLAGPAQRAKCGTFRVLATSRRAPDSGHPWGVASRVYYAIKVATNEADEGNSVTSTSRRRSEQLRDAVSEKPDDGSTPEQPRARRSGAVAAMGRALDSLTANEADNWRAGSMHENVQELDTGLFTPSTVSDRIPTADDAGYQALRAAIRDNGQMIPIIARPHPDAEGQFQIAAGHRRWRVAQEIGRPLKAIIRALSDQEMVILQGQENGARADLSFIERARFALQMEALGHTRDTLAAALNVDKPEVSRLLMVAQAVGESLMLAIGPAPKVGRPRWLALAKALDTPETRRRLDAVMSSDQFQGAPTDRRFSIVLQALEDQKDAGAPQDRGSDRLAWVEKKGGKTRLILEDPDFAAYLESCLPWLFRQFERKRG